MKIYTRTGDNGETGLYGGARVSKASTRVSAYGEVDELNSFIGLARLAVQRKETEAMLAKVQSQLFDLGAELATPADKLEAAIAKGMPTIEIEDITSLENDIDACDLFLAPLQTFVLPGGSEGAARLHLARTVCRRAERDVIKLIESGETVRPTLLHYLNRLSDALFVWARAENHAAGVADVPWMGRKK